jgi:CheY-like chemotaxis protein
MMQRDLFDDLPQGSRYSPLVFIADDSPTMRIVTRHALERAGFQTIEVAAPLEALAAAREVLPEIFLLDITFAAGAQTDGYQLCRALRDLPVFRATPILLVSGHDGIIDKARGRLAGRLATSPSRSTCNSWSRASGSWRTRSGGDGKTGPRLSRGAGDRASQRTPLRGKVQ